MATILSFLIAGIVLGFLLRREQRVLTLSGKVTAWSVYLLLFFLGTSVGVNETVMNILGQLGLQAIVLSGGGIVGSVVVSYFVYRHFFGMATDEQ